MISRQFKIHSGKAQGSFKGEVYCDIHEPAEYAAATPPEGYFQLSRLTKGDQ